jgi:hypothetical protein
MFFGSEIVKKTMTYFTTDTQFFLLFLLLPSFKFQNSLSL